jgi:hypothetical protein
LGCGSASPSQAIPPVQHLSLADSI